MKLFVTLKKRLVFLKLRIPCSLAVKPLAKRTVAVGTNNGRIGRMPILNNGHQTASPRHMCGDRRFKKIRRILSPYVGDWNGRIALIFCYVSHSPAARLVLDKRGTRLPAERARLGDVGGEVPQ